MDEQRHEPDERFRRDPRDWGRFWVGYTAHFAQGLLVCAGLGFAALPILAWYYLSYQTTEYQRFSDVRDMYLRLRGEENEAAKSWIVGDWISRDIGDWLIGGHVGALIGIAWQVVLILQFVD